MAHESFKAPSTIPPRTSSHNLGNASILSPTSKPSKHRGGVVETEWIAQSKRGSSSAAAGAASKSPGHAYRHSYPHTHTYPVPMSPPPRDPLKNIADELIFQRHASWVPEKEKILLGPYEYLLGHPGKDIRSRSIVAFNAFLKVPEESLVVITKVIGMLHTASLLVDDVEDSSALRRGVPVAHNIFGTAQTINSANYVYFLALRELFKLKSPKAIDIYTEELINLHRGQGMDLFWRDTLTCPSEADYLEMVGNKTGGLFRLAVKLMQAESEVQIDCVPLVNTIGLLFQILDDYQNLNSPAYTSSKGLCEDLTEGKFSFPVIHAIRADQHNLVLLNILKQKTTDPAVKRYAVDYMEREGSFAYTRKVLRDLTRKATSLMEELEGQLGEEGKGRGDGVRAILEKLKVDSGRPNTST